MYTARSVLVCIANAADHNDNNDDGDGDGEDSLLMVYALEKNETCYTRNKSTNESHIMIRCLIDKGFDAHKHNLFQFSYLCPSLKSFAMCITFF